MGGLGVTGSADPFRVGVIPRYPGERADPSGQEEAGVIDTSVVTEDVTKLPTSSSEQASPRQPPTVSDTTAAAFLRSTIAIGYSDRARLKSVRTAVEQSRHKFGRPYILQSNFISFSGLFSSIQWRLWRN